MFSTISRLTTRSRCPTATATALVAMSKQPVRRHFVTVIDQATVAYRSSFGINRVRLEPGIRLNIPIVHTLDRVNMRKQRIDVKHMTAITKDNVVVEISGSLFYRVVDANAALFEIQDYRGSVERVGTSALRSIIGQNDYDKINSSRAALNTSLVEAIGRDCAAWGIECTQYEIQDIVPTSREVVKHLESQMEAERRRRSNELDTEAAVNTAEGKKKASILEAQAEFETQRLKAEAAAYSIQTESVANAERIRIIAHALGTDDPLLISQYLIEQSKQQHLATLAKNTLSSTYFFPESQMMLPAAKMMADLFHKNKLPEIAPTTSSTNA